jgi:septum site-determining protein MinD
MAQIIVVTSGKGGVGKTTTSASISMGLAQKGFKTAVIDFDVGLRNLDLIMGCERRVVYDFVDVIEKKATLNQALIKDKREDNLYILAASQSKDKDALTQEGVERVINELKEDGFDYIVCDSPAGIEQGALMAMYFANHAIIVSNPEVSSIRDSDRIIGLLDSKTERAKQKGQMKKHLLITRYNEERASRDEMLKTEDIEELLSLPLIGVITESEDVINASNLGQPVIMNEESNAGLGYKDCVDRICGEEKELIIHSSVKKKGFFKSLFGG